MTLTETKPWYRSLGVIGGGLAVAGGTADIGPAVVDLITFALQMALSHGTEIDRPAIDVGRLVTDIVTIAGGIGAIFGRVRATRRIG
jgi:hypothetical protein